MMYRISVNLKDDKKLETRQISSTLDAVEYQEELNSMPEVRNNFLIAFAEIPALDITNLSGRQVDHSMMETLETYDELIEFLGRAVG